MKTSLRFWIGMLAVLCVGVPCALLARARWQPAGEEGHIHGDPKLEAAVAGTIGASRLALLHQSARDAKPATRQAVAEALAKESGADALALAQELLADNDSEVRVKAAYAVAQAGTESARPLVRAALRDDDDWVRLEMAQWAATNAGRPGRLAGVWLVPDLMMRLDDPSDAIRAFSTTALSKLTGKPWRDSHRLSAKDRAVVFDHWKAWWRTRKQGDSPPVPDIAPRRTDPAPAVSLKTIDGATLAPATSGRVTLLNFWGTWCAPCIQEVPDIERIHRRYGSQGVDVVGVALSEQNGASGLRAWCRKNGLTYAQSLAEDAVTEAYGDIHEVPISVLVDKQGRIRYRWQGERDYESFAARIDRLLRE